MRQLRLTRFIFFVVFLVAATMRGGAQPVAAFTNSPDTATFTNNCFTFTDHSTGNIVQWDWDFGFDHVSYTTPTPTLLYCYPDTGCFLARLIVTDNMGASDTTEKILCLKKGYQLFLPSAFTPNGDGSNDIFVPKGVYCGTAEMRIFSRWGVLVYAEEDSEFLEGWNGRSVDGTQLAPEGPYLYEIIVTECNGTKHEYRNTVLLMR